MNPQCRECAARDNKCYHTHMVDSNQGHDGSCQKFKPYQAQVVTDLPSALALLTYYEEALVDWLTEWEGYERPNALAVDRAREAKVRLQQSKEKP